ncbi:MAG: hypothetical protein DI535_10500 [Citrobacter freundii]|nr:MAG: hypothetical protein DI535_10500 [Citrobacter freundii]
MTTSRKSIFSSGGLILLASVLLMMSSCTPQDKGGVHIPVPKDTSGLSKIDHFISVEQINSFRSGFGAQRDTLARQNPGLYFPLSETFNKQALLDLLKDSTNVGIRIYYGIKPGSNRNEVRLMLVGVNSEGKDLFYEKGGADGGKVAAQLPPSGKLGGVEYGQCDPPCLK